MRNHSTETRRKCWDGNVTKEICYSYRCATHICFPGPDTRQRLHAEASAKVTCNTLGAKILSSKRVRDSAVTRDATPDRRHAGCAALVSNFMTNQAKGGCAADCIIFPLWPVVRFPGAFADDLL